MNRNPIIPFILIMVFGLGLVFFLSMEGLNNADEMAEGEHGEGHGEEVAEGGEFDPEAAYQSSCIGCHGGDYQGAVGPSLVGLDYSKEEIVDILANGKGGGMPGGLVAGNEEAMAEWLLTLE